MIRNRLLSLIALSALLTACLDMDVENLNQPDRDRALSEAGDVESLLATGFYRYWNGTQKTNPEFGLAVAANILTSSWGNFGMQHLGTQPRLSWDNSPTFGYRAFNANPWNNMYEAISNVTDGIHAMEGGLRFVEDDRDMNPRALAYAKFIQGAAHGFLAQFFDQAMILDETVNLEEGVPEMRPYTEVMDRAIQYLEEAIEVASRNTFALPGGEAGWVNGVAVTNEELVMFAHSLIARYMAGVARTPQERQAVNWSRVIHHAERGYNRDQPWGPLLDANFWWHASQWYDHSWARAAYDLIGPADTSGAYEAWRNTPPAERNSFHIHTADRRITGADGPTSPGKYIRFRGGTPFPADRGMYFQSWYEFSRWRYVRAAGVNQEQMPHFTRAEMDLLRAEGHLRQNNLAAAVELINRTRVGVGELPPLQVSDGQDAIWQALQYEKLLETTSTASGVGFFSKRGWGTLVCGTPLHFPVPGAELEQLGIANYTFGGSGEDTANTSDGCQP